MKVTDNSKVFRSEARRFAIDTMLIFIFAMAMMLISPVSAKASEAEYKVWVGGTRVTSANANDIPAAVSGNKTAGTASYNAETKTLTLDNYVYSGDCTGDYINAGGSSYNGHTVIFVGGSNVVNTIIIKGNVSLIQSNTSSSPYGLTYLVNYSNLTIKGEGENPKLIVTGGNGGSGNASNGISLSSSNLLIKDCAVEATGGNGSIECSGILAGNITLENSTLTASCNNNYSPVGTYTKGYGIRFYPGGSYKLTVDNKSTVTVKGNSQAVYNGTVVNSSTGTGWSDMSMTGDGTPIEVNTTGSAYEYMAMQFLPPPPQIESGDGTVDNPYIIKTADDMAIFRDIVMGENRQTKNQTACAKLKNNITLTGTWTPIGTAYDASAYKGLFDGDGHTINGLSITSGNYGGIFGAVFSGTVKNLIVEGSINIENDSGGVYVGGVAGMITRNSAIENCISKVNISVKNTATGGNPYNRGVGGIVGLLKEESTVSLCHNEGVVSDAHADSNLLSVGGIVGASSESNSTIINCYNTGSIIKNGSTCYAGGIIGFAYAAIQNCHSYISGSATEPIGYIPSSHGTFENLYYLADTTGEVDSNGQRALSSTDFESLSNLTGFDSTVWTIRNDTPKYPVLKCQIPYVALDNATPATITLPDSHSVPVVGDTLAAVCDATNLTYQWYRGNTAIDGATNPTYTVTTADLESAIKVVVTQAVDESGTALTTPRTKESTATSAVVKKTPAVLTADDARTNSGINYAAETVTPATGYEVSSSSTTYTAVTSLTSILDGEGTPKIYVRTAETTDTAAGSWVEVTLTSRPVAPTGLSSTNATNGSTENGTITGTSKNQQYKNKDANGTPATWTDVTNTSISGLKPGTYLVRTKATTDASPAPAGRITEVTVGSDYTALDESNKPTITVSDSHNPPVIGDTLTASTIATDIVYEWYRESEKINNATESTYTLTADDAGKAITVKVYQTKNESGTDYSEGNRPVQTSVATAAVAKKAAPNAPADAEAASFVPNYADETFTVGNTYEVSTTNTDAGVITNGSLTGALDGEGKVYIRVKETSDTYASDWLEVTLTARGNAPEGFTTEKASSSSASDGKIKGLNNTMEYKLKGSSDTWTSATQDEVSVKAGTYLIRYKSENGNPASKSAEVTVAGTSGGSSGGSSGESGGGSSGGSSGGESGGASGGETYSGKVEGSGDNTSSTTVSATISEGTATIAEVTPTEITKVAEATTAGQTTSLVLDVSGAPASVTSIEISKSTVENIAAAAGDDSSAINGTTIKLPTGDIEFDATATQSINDQAQGDSVKIEIAQTKQEELTAAQQETLKNENLSDAKVVGVNVTSGSSAISDFNGGKARVSFADEAPQGKNPNYYHMYFLSTAGTLTRMLTTHMDNIVQFMTGHNSEYVLVYDETDLNENVPPISEAIVENLIYNGSEQDVKVTTVRADAVELKDMIVPDLAYTLSGDVKVKEVGTYKVVITAKDGGGYRGSTEVTYEVKKADQKMTVSAKDVKAKRGKKIKPEKVFTIENAVGKVKYTKVEGDKKIKISDTGKIKIKKNLKKGKYTVKVLVSSEGDGNYNGAEQTVEFVIKVK